MASVSAGTRLGAYEILGPLGAGGMGEVYQARDTRLGRTVAIKVLPAGKEYDEEAKRRFLNEARAASALNHPNIAAIYDISSEMGTDFIVMEYVGGTGLDKIIATNAPELPDAIAIAAQIAGAVASAHAAGIVHRDIKPANIIVTPQGQAKVLDFGLAKLGDPGNAASHEGATKTIALRSRETAEGAIVGTAAYMSPEQARGQRVDRRSDIFSLGAVLYELFTGRRAFPGKTTLDTISAILRDEPARVRSLQPGVPPELERLVERCLRKDPARRFQCADDLYVQLLDLKEAGPATVESAPGRAAIRNWWVWAALPAMALLGAVAAWLAFEWRRAPEPGLAAAPFTSYPGSERFATFSPDGRQVAFSWNGEKQDNFDIYLKLIGTGAPLRLTTDPAPDFYPAWSPDGRWIAFLRLLPDNQGAVTLVPALGGPERRLTTVNVPDSVGYVQGVSPPRVAWSADSNLLVIVDRTGPGGPFGLFSLAVDTGEKRLLSKPDDASLIDSGPAVSPDGRTVAFTRSAGNMGNGDIYTAPVDASLRRTGDVKRITTDNAGSGHPAWTADGRWIVFSSPRAGGTFGLWRVAPSGSGEPRRLSAGEDGLFPALSRQGNRLIYTKYRLDSNIWRVDTTRPDGAAAPLITSTRQDVMPHYSPDGNRVAFASDQSGYFEIWVTDADGSNGVQLTSLRGVNFYPAWSPDGQMIAFEHKSEYRDEIYVVNSSGGKPRRLEIGNGGSHPSFSRDGGWIYFASDRTGQTASWKVPLQGGAPSPIPGAAGGQPEESADGRELYFWRSRGVFRVPVGGGAATEVVADVAGRGYAAAGGKLYFTRRGKSAARSEYYEAISDNALMSFDLATGKLREAALLPRPLQLGVTASPDGRWVLYSQIDQVIEDLMLVEAFR